MRERVIEQEANIALLIDADNASPEHLDEVLLVLGELGTINIRRAYGNWAKTSLKGWGNLTGRYSIVPILRYTGHESPPLHGLGRPGADFVPFPLRYERQINAGEGFNGRP